MRVIILSALFFLSYSFSQSTKKVCFLGNSYIYTNDLPGMISSLATADGNTLIKDQHTPGGYTLMNHSTNPTSLTKISSDTWDYVVLQDQSQLPSFPWSQVQTEVLPYAAILTDSIRSANECAIPLFFNTWGRKDGDPQWDSINTFDKMNQRLFYAYGYMADTHSGKRAPVGNGFDHIQNDLAPPVTHTDLYSGDGSHPSIFGTYLAACIFYEIIFEQTCQGNNYLPSGISAPQAAYLQNVAGYVVNDVDSVEVDYTQPLANFSYQLTGNQVTFINESEHAFDWNWNFGDGNLSSEENPIHTYSGNGNYSVTLTAEYCGRLDDTTLIVNFTLSNNSFESADFVLAPNVTSNGLFKIIYTGTETTAELWSLDGSLINLVNLSEPLPVIITPGQYIVRIGTQTRKLIVL